MRLGGPVYQQYSSPEEWVQAVRVLGYRAAYCPVGTEADATTIAAYARAAREADILIAEVGAWSNPLSPNPTERDAALEKCKASLFLAEQIGARCCVNIAGSRGAKWDGPDPADLTEETFQMIVDSIREIIDSVKPKRAFYTLEPMPWMYPDSVDSYLELIAAIDRKAFAVHFDPVNLINCPERYFHNADFLCDCIDRLGPYIRSCHAKDIKLGDHLTVHLDEVRPGLGGLDYHTFLRQVSRCDPDMPVMLEHLSSENDYLLAAAHLRQAAQDIGVKL
jgi:sugar phosphate isomerase/epimerase